MRAIRAATRRADSTSTARRCSGRRRRRALRRCRAADRLRVAAQPGCGGIVASGADLQFLPETNDAIELGAKYNGGWIDLNVAVFHQLFKNFQLNTFNGLNFIVENINSCSEDLGGADTDNRSAHRCLHRRHRAGVKEPVSRSRRSPVRCAISSINAGVTYSNAKYRDNLVGAGGKPLSNALFQLPGRQISNAPKWTMTGSAAWTPPIGGGGMHALDLCGCPLHEQVQHRLRPRHREDRRSRSRS